MTKLLIATFFLFLDYSIPFGNGVLGLLPDFAGYALLWAGARELDGYSDRFADICLYSKVLLPVTALLYVLDALGLTNPLGMYGLLGLRIGMTLAALFVSYRLIFGINGIEVKLHRNMKTAKLMLGWKVAAVLMVAAYALLLIPSVAAFGSTLLLAAGLYYVLVFSRSSRLFTQE